MGDPFNQKSAAAKDGFVHPQAMPPVRFHTVYGG
jgi:hypothetical protein